MDKYRKGWRERKTRRKSLWHLPKVLLSFVFIGIIWHYLFLGMWRIHLIFYPEHTNSLIKFWSSGISFKAFISSFLLVIPLFLPSIGLGFILINLIFWLLPKVRKTFEKEANKDPEMTFAGATSQLIKVFFKYLLPIGFGLSLLGALTLSSFK